MTRLFSIVAVGIEGLVSALVTHRRYESLAAQLLLAVVSVLPTASILAGWLLARGARRATDESISGGPPSS